MPASHAARSLVGAADDLQAEDDGVGGGVDAGEGDVL
jgi:hypothetical protein